MNQTDIVYCGTMRPLYIEARERLDARRRVRRRQSTILVLMGLGFALGVLWRWL